MELESSEVPGRSLARAEERAGAGGCCGQGEADEGEAELEISERDEADTGAAEALHGRRNQGDPQVCRDESEHRDLAVGFLSDARPDAGALKRSAAGLGPNGLDLGAHENEWLPLQITDAQARSPSQRIMTSDGDDERFFRDDALFEIGRLHWTAGKPNLDASGAQCFRLERRAHFDELESDLGAGFAERANERRQHFVGRGRSVTDRDRAGLALANTPRLRARARRLAEQVTRAIEQEAARLGQRDVAPVTFEKACTDESLELLDLHAERWLRNVQASRGAAEMQLFGDGNEGPQQARLELIHAIHIERVSQQQKLVLDGISGPAHPPVVRQEQEVFEMRRSIVTLLCLLGLASCSRDRAASQSMDEKRIVIERYFSQLFNQGKVALVTELLHPDYVNGSPGSPELPRGREGVAIVVKALRTAFPDLRYEIEDMVIGADAVAVRTTLRGTHRGDFFGIAPTGRSVEVSQMTIERFKDGKIVAHHRLTDELTLQRQLGVVK
jgi:steroid delta-isomerase-like uncharacterized protein